MSGEVGIYGAPVRVQVQNKQERELEKAARELLLNKKVVGVYLSGDQLEIETDDGATFSMLCSGGFKQAG